MAFRLWRMLADATIGANDRCGQSKPQSQRGWTRAGAIAWENVLIAGF